MFEQDLLEDVLIIANFFEFVQAAEARPPELALNRDLPQRPGGSQKSLTDCLALAEEALHLYQALRG